MPKPPEPYPLPHEVVPDDWFLKLNRKDLFPGDAPIELDLGCGDGSFLIRMADHFRERRFLGVERLLGRVRKVSRKATQASLENVRLLRLDSNYAIHRLLPNEFATRIHFLCPDPWPKKKHAKRRQMCQLPLLKALHHLLVENGELLFMTDSPDYFAEAMEVQVQCEFFDQLHWEPGDFFYPPTDFEEQWIAEGRSMHRLRLRKTES
ncbi:MAG: tRNA (guanosine(46)-N7)-methyltransferase TrmB [Verrucomicrobiota bacterium]